MVTTNSRAIAWRWSIRWWLFEQHHESGWRKSRRCWKSRFRCTKNNSKNYIRCTYSWCNGRTWWRGRSAANESPRRGTWFTSREIGRGDWICDWSRIGRETFQGRYADWRNGTRAYWSRCIEYDGKNTRVDTGTSLGNWNPGKTFRYDSIF